MGGSLAQDLADAARQLQGKDDAQDTMEVAVRLAVAQVDGADDCGISLVDGKGSVRSPAYSADRVRRADELQVELDEGPCLQAIREHETVYSPNVAEDDRWPEWGRTVSERFGVNSMLCFQLFTTEDNVGALNLYSSSVDGFDRNDREHGLALAAHVAVAVAAVQEIDQLKGAVDTRTVIGEALGILMERFDLTPEQAFTVLTRVSNTQNIKLRVLASELVRTRRIPGLPGPRGPAGSPTRTQEASRSR